MPKKFDFEKTMVQLEKLVEQLSSEQTPLEQSIEEYQKGITMAKQALDFLKKAEAKVAKIATKEEVSESEN